MVYQLDPTIPRVWRSPHALQFGVERPRLVLDPLDAAGERMVSALAAGVALGALRLIARGAGASPDAADALIARLEPVLAREPGGSDPGARDPIVVLDGSGPTAARILSLLREAGVDARSGLTADDPAVDDAAAAVVIASFAVAPHRHQRWLRRDIPHLAVVFGDAGATVGPLVRPGESACLRCLDLHRRDRDPAWPALAAQLHTRPAPGESELVCGAVASAAAALVIAAVDTPRERRSAAAEPGGPSATATASRYDAATARWTEIGWEPHSECGCLTPLCRAPADLTASDLTRPEVQLAAAPARRGTGTAAEGSGAPADCSAAPSSAAGDAGRA
jgi:bacteriocin biosynthesis cyclodehydratase domain-containing protein